jgi:hypothetical protein
MRTLLLLAALVHLTPADPPAGNYELRGQLPGVPAGTKVYLSQYRDLRHVRLDSAAVDGAGQFVLQGQIPEPAMYSFAVAGQPAPGFALVTATGGDSLRLSSLRGRYVVLHFWHLNPFGPEAKVRRYPGSSPAELLPLYQWAQDRPVELVSVALTPDQVRWLAEVQRTPGVNWPQAAEARGLQGPLAEAYNINRSPGFVLIGPDARLLGLGLELDEVEKQLRQLLP